MFAILKELTGAALVAHPDVDKIAFTGSAEVAGRSCAAREEMFGPVACVIPFDDEAAAIRIANDAGHGLAAAVWTRATSSVRCAP
jgi:acyl-CoA reductase-like NAD-dependent aldehyde dehydrogenase